MQLKRDLFYKTARKLPSSKSSVGGQPAFSCTFCVLYVYVSLFYF